MADYKEMYRVLFRGVTQAIGVLQQAQRQAEEIYLSTSPQLYVLGDATAQPKKEGDGE